MKNIIFYLVIFCFLNSCKTIDVKPSLKETTTVNSSIKKELKTIDSLVIVRKSDTVKLKEQIEKLTQKPIIKRSNNAKLSIRRIGNTIEAVCIADELKELIQLQKEIINHYKEINTNKQESIIIPQRYIPSILKPLIWIGGIVVLFLIATLLLKFIKPKIL